MNKTIKDAFFRLYSTKIGAGDIEFAQKSYYALVRTVTEMLRTNERVNLPDLGEMVIKRRPAHNRHHVGLKTIVHQPETKEIKFNFCRDFRSYIRDVKTTKDIVSES